MAERIDTNIQIKRTPEEMKDLLVATVFKINLLKKEEDQQREERQEDMDDDHAVGDQGTLENLLLLPFLSSNIKDVIRRSLEWANIDGRLQTMRWLTGNAVDKVTEDFDLLDESRQIEKCFNAQVDDTLKDWSRSTEVRS